MFAFNTPAWEECLSILITCIQMFNLQWSSVTINQSSIYIYIQWSIIVHHPPSYHHQTSVNNTSIRLNLTKHTWAHYFCLTLHLCSDACSMGFLTRDQTAINSPCCSSCPASDKISRHTTPRRPDVSDPEAKKIDFSCIQSHVPRREITVPTCAQLRLHWHSKSAQHGAGRLEVSAHGAVQTSLPKGVEKCVGKTEYK